MFDLLAALPPLPMIYANCPAAAMEKAFGEKIQHGLTFRHKCHGGGGKRQSGSWILVLSKYVCFPSLGEAALHAHGMAGVPSICRCFAPSAPVPRQEANLACLGPRVTRNLGLDALVTLAAPENT